MREFVKVIPEIAAKTQPQNAIVDTKDGDSSSGPKPTTDPYAPTQLGDANGRWVNNPDASIAPGLAL
eukprot:325858-Karenia_brevis.AAC.1